MSNYLFIRSFTKIDLSKIVAKKVVVFYGLFTWKQAKKQIKT